MQQVSKLRIVARGRCLPDSDWLNAALVSLGHHVRGNFPGPGKYDMLLVHDPSSVTRRELESARRMGALTVLRAWHDPETCESAANAAADYDWVLTTGLAEMVNVYAASGARALPLLPSGPPLAGSPQQCDRDIDIIFAGRLSGPERKRRVELLSRAALRWRIAVVTEDSDDWPGAYRFCEQDLVQLHRRSRLSLHNDALTLNRLGVTRRSPGRRPFFGPNYGCALLAELNPWLTQCFDPAAELVGFSDVDHGLRCATEMLEDPQRLNQIAAAGAKRCKTDHTPVNRAAQLALLASGTVPTGMRVLALGPWYQQITLPDGESTSHLAHSNVERWKRLEPWFPDVRGRSVLDLGMNAGFFSLMSARWGSRRVTGVERSALFCAQARFVFECWNSTNIEIVEDDVLAAPAGPYDICLALALLHHFDDIGPILRLAIDRCSELVLEWEVRPSPFCHPIDKVTTLLRTAGWQLHIVSGGSRPIVLARAKEKRH